MSLPSAVSTESVSLAASAFVTFTVAARPVTPAAPLPPATVTASLRLVPSTITWSAWPSAAPRSTFTLVDLGCGQVVRSDRVGAAERVDVDLLHAVGVHRDVGDVAEEPEPASVRRQVDLLGDVGAVEDHRVGAALALDGVAAVARIPRERVVAGAQERDVAAPVSVDRVVPRAADQRLCSGASGERVVSDSAVDRRRDGVGEDAVALVDAHGVVAAAGVDVDLRDVRPVEAEDGRAVTDVDLERAGLAGLQAKRDRVALLGAFDLQHAVASASAP